jgi:hypothetical protein
MRKLLLLLFLIPVLSWSDCGLETLGNYKGKTVSGKPLPTEIIEEMIKTHCEHHRCAAINNLTPTCICENLGGVVREPNNLYRCGNNKVSTNFDEYFTNEKREHLQEKSQALVPPPTPTPATTTSRISITDAKAQCSDIGFKTGTERFGECVLELMQ